MRRGPRHGFSALFRMTPRPGFDVTDDLLAAVHRELRSLAAMYMRNERPDHTLQTTALVHEAYVRMRGRDDAGWQTPVHFVAVAATTMRQVLVDHARARNTDKRRADRSRVPLEAVYEDVRADPTDLCALDEALRRLAAETPRAARVVELRFFGGLTVAEVAGLLDLTERTIERDWRYAQAWLRRAMSRGALESTRG